MAKEKKLEHIQVKDNGIKLSNKIGDELADTKQRIEKKYFESLLKASDESSIVRYKIIQNNAYREFQANTASIIKKAKEEVKTTLKDDKTVNLTDKQVKALSKEVNQGLLRLQNDANISYQRFINETVYKVHAAEELKEQLVKHLASGLNIGVVYKNGKTYQFDTYYEMKARTDIQQDIGKNLVSDGHTGGVIFYICTFYGDCAPDHVEYQGKIYYDEDWESNAPKDRVDEIKEYISANKLMSIQQVMDAPVYLSTRPNCRHYFQYIDIDSVLGAKTKEDVNKLREERNLNFGGKYQPDKYKALQQQRQNERKIRAEKSKLQDLEIQKKLEPDNRELQVKINNSIANIKAYQEEQRNLIWVYDKKKKKKVKRFENLERRYDREKLGNRVTLGTETK